MNRVLRQYFSAGFCDCRCRTFRRLCRGWRGSLPGIAGVAAGAAVVAGISATSLGLLLAQSALAFTVIQLMGAAYLVWLGIKLWRAPAQDWADAAQAPVLSPAQVDALRGRADSAVLVLGGGVRRAGSRAGCR